MKYQVIQTKTGITYIPLDNYSDNLTDHTEALADLIIIDEDIKKDSPIIYNFLKSL